MTHTSKLHIALLWLVCLLLALLSVARPVEFAADCSDPVCAAHAEEEAGQLHDECGEKCATPETHDGSGTCPDSPSRCGGLCACCFLPLPPGPQLRTALLIPHMPVRYLERSVPIIDVAPRAIEHPPC